MKAESARRFTMHKYVAGTVCCNAESQESLGSSNKKVDELTPPPKPPRSPTWGGLTWPSFLIAAIVLSTGCALPQTPTPSSCGKHSCPIGGEIASDTEARSGIELGKPGLTFNQGTNAIYKLYGEGKCRYACKFQACPVGSAPKITAEKLDCTPLCPNGTAPEIKDKDLKCVPLSGSAPTSSFIQVGSPILMTKAPSLR